MQRIICPGRKPGFVYNPHDKQIKLGVLEPKIPDSVAKINNQKLVRGRGLKVKGVVLAAEAKPLG